MANNKVLVVVKAYSELKNGSNNNKIHINKGEKHIIKIKKTKIHVIKHTRNVDDNSNCLLVHCAASS
jgi:hypothetical protein